MAKRTRKFRDVLHKDLQDPEFAQEYLNAAFEAYNEDSDLNALLLSVRDIAAAYGVQDIAEKTGRSRGSIYKSLTEDADPRFGTVLELLHTMGFRFGRFKLKHAS